MIVESLFPHYDPVAERVLRVANHLSLTRVELREYLSLSEDYLRQIECGKAHVSLVSLTRFCESLDLDLDRFIRGQISLEEIKKRGKAIDQHYLPEKYQLGAFSKIRTSKSAIEFIQKNLGWRLTDRILKKLQVGQSVFNDLERSVNIDLVTDIAGVLVQYHAGHDLLYAMGKFSSRTNKTGAVGHFFSDCTSPKEIYEHLIPVLGKFFEKNHDYTIISLGDHHCWIQAVVSSELKEIRKGTKVGSLSLCHARRGIAASFAEYCDDIEAQCVETHCVHRGDSVCRYWVSWKKKELKQPYFDLLAPSV